MRTLWLKIVGVMAVVLILALGAVGYAYNRAATTGFDVYVSRGGQRWAEALAPQLEDYYARTGSWDGVAAFLESSATPGMGRGRGATAGQGGAYGAPAGQHVILADEQGRVVADSLGQLVGQSLGADELGQGVALAVGSRQVGTLVVSAPMLHEGPEAEFLAQVRNGIIVGGVVAGLLALALGSLLAFQITSPLRALTQAARRVAGGDLAQRIPVRSRDEVGELTQAFNDMASALERNETLRRNMMADIAHELRTPLAAMRGNLEGILDGVFPATGESVAPIYEQTLLLSRLVDDLRELALAEAGQMRLERRPLDVGELLQGVAAMVRPQAESQGVGVEVQVAAPLPAADADPTRIRQVLLNLVGNALRHTPAGGVITLSAEASEEGITVSVSDTGSGIDPADLPHIFDRFYRGDSSRARDTGGHGLGLAIVKRWVEIHGGRVWAENLPSGGARFSFTLPVRPGETL
ncbi:MAG: HAMP domain-containing protein [Chloroflexi bacterium]|nr:HAMP domain-containing protein [Chloroflexota bacterium]